MEKYLDIIGNLAILVSCILFWAYVWHLSGSVKNSKKMIHKTAGQLNELIDAFNHQNYRMAKGVAEHLRSKKDLTSIEQQHLDSALETIRIFESNYEVSPN